MKQFLLSLALGAVSLRAGTIVDAGPPTGQGITIVTQRIADDFVLSGSADINQINFWYSGLHLADLSTVSWGIYGNSGGQLNALLAGGTTAPTTSTSAYAGIYFAQFTIPDLVLSTGTYWLELHAGTSLADNTATPVGWATSNETAPYAALRDGDFVPLVDHITTAGIQQYAFQLAGPGGGGSATPEPSAMLLCGGGLAALALVVRRKLR
jgi:PEP-CTERM motif